MDGASVGPKTSYTFTNVKKDHSITAEFDSRTGGDKTVLLEEDFQNCTAGGAMPDGWTVEKTNSNSTWTVYKYYYADKTLTASCGDDYTSKAKQDERLITPVLDMSNGGGAISFRYIGGKTPTINGDYTVKLEASKDGSTWMTLWTSTDLKNTTYDEIGYSGNTLSANVVVNIPAELQSSTTKLAFHYERPAGENSGRGAVDNIRITANQASSSGGESILLDENFDQYEGNLPTGWEKTSTNTDAKYTWQVKKSYNRVLASCDADTYDDSDNNWGWSVNSKDITVKNGAKQDERLITPVLAMNGKTGAVTFQFSGNTSLLKNSKMTVTLEGSVDDGKTWTELWNAQGSVGDMKTGVISNYIGTADVTVDIPEAMQKDGLKLSFRYQRKAYSTDGGPVYIDDVKLIASGGSSENPTKPTTYTITASAGQGGSIAPNGAVSVAKGESKQFTIIPSEGYEIEDVKVDGVSKGAKTAYEFTNVTENHTIAASFKAKTVTLPDSIHEDFNNGDMPNGWTVEGPSAKYNVETWKVARYTDFKSDAAVCSQNYMGNQAQNEKLILPQINMQDNMELTFDFGASYDTLSSDSFQFTVKATKDKGQTWTTLWDAKDHMGTIDADNEPENITGKGSIAIPAQFCDGSAQFAFVFESSKKQGGSVAVDNVVLDKGSSTGTTMYGITIAAMEHGTVTANRSVAAAGDIITLTVTPEEGYQLKSGSLMANDAVVTGNTFTMPDKAVRITALFEQKAVTPTTGSYKDGTYTGSAQGRNGKVSVTVTVENGNISSIDVTEQKESKDYWQKAIAIIEKLLGRGNDSAVAGVDTVTGATLSSAAIKKAVQNALKNAVEENSGIFASGNGSESRPYIIDNVKRLQDFAAAVNAGENYAGKYIALAANLDLSDIAWTPIGTADHGKYNGFSGTFDGRGYTVSNVICGTGSASADYEAIGLFGVVDGGTVKNLNVTITKFYNRHDDSNYMTAMGGLTGVLTNSGAIDHCSVSGGSQVASETSGPKAAVGGLVGWAQSGTLIANSWTDIGLNYGTMSTDVDVSMGGICGKQEQNSLIANSASFGSVPGMIMTGKLRVGGLVGQTSGAIYNSYTTSLTKANVMGDPYNSFANNDATTAIGHLIGCSTTGAALYDCYYDKNADQFSNSDMAGDPEEGKTERRQATGWENGSNVKTDKSFIEAKTASELTSAAFAAVLNGNLKNTIKSAATAYFQSKNLLTGSAGVAGMEDKLDSGFRSWALTGDRVLFGDAPVTTVEVCCSAEAPDRSIRHSKVGARPAENGRSNAER